MVITLTARAYSATERLRAGQRGPVAAKGFRWLFLKNIILIRLGALLQCKVQS